ncbi:MAG: metallophosphoesterase family protein [Candidatus Hodarchaeales archaeon]
MTLIAIISDIHANLAAINAVIQDIRMNAHPEEIWCTGDIVGYYTRPCEVLQRVFDICTTNCLIKGNHDDAAGKGLVPEYWHPLAAEAIYWTTKRLDLEKRRLLHSLPTMLSLKRDGKVILLIHGGPEYPLEQYVRPDNKAYLEQCISFMEFVDVDFLFLGHIHVPFVYTSRGRTIINSGSVGQPRDFDSRACYSLFDPRSGEIIFQRIEYDYTITMAGIRENKLPLGLANRLPEGV